MKRHFFYPLILLVLIFMVLSCKGNKTETTPEAESLPILIDITKNYPERNILLQDVAEIDYIPLETTDEFLWKGWSITAITDKYIMDADTRSGIVLIFGRDGKAVKSFNRLGSGGEEYTSPGEFILDDDNEEIFVNDRNNEKVLVYDLDGKYKRTIDYAEDMYYTALTNYDRNTLIGYNQIWDNNVDNEYFLMDKSTGEIIRKFVAAPVSEKLNERIVKEEGESTMVVMFMHYPIIANPAQFTLNEISNDTIFVLDSSFDLHPYIVQIPGRRTLKPEIMLSYSGETGKYIFLNTVKKEFDMVKMRGFANDYLLYDKQERKVYQQMLFNDDFIPQRGFTVTAGSVINFNKNSYAYTIEASKLVEAYENDALKGKLKEIAANLEEDDNPIVAIVRFKE